jgi:hypothetical protein
VVEYEVEVRRPDAPEEAVTLVGKVRARRSGNEGLRQLESVWDAGFDSGQADGISVPEPLGVISQFQMWFQRKVPGATATDLLSGSAGAELGRRIATAAHKLHQASLPTERTHSMADELHILRECLAKVVALKPEWRDRLDRSMRAAEHLGAAVSQPRLCGIHRDFYPAQVIVDGPRLWLIDFDLFCQGDPGLDIGNFIGHMIETSLRETGNANAQAMAAEALENHFISLSGETTRASVRAYTTLTLLRHVYLSTQFVERRHLTEALLELCELRLGCTLSTAVR